jgi:hypothetical protein
MIEFLKGLGVLVVLFMVCGVFTFCLTYCINMRVRNYYRQRRRDEKVLWALSGQQFTQDRHLQEWQDSRGRVIAYIDLNGQYHERSMNGFNNYPCK